ncbi:MAG TPA: hypothetical protein VHE78_08935 [Gemmatimonadaceae bacterium]|nr:hypothetical protein [Gemmatimonadaceae bacterium]
MTVPRASFLSRLRALSGAYPWTTRLLWGITVLILGADAWLFAKRVSYVRETARLREGLSAVERARIDAALASDSNRLQVMIELARRQARADAGLHLSVAVDSGVLYLEQEGAMLRATHVEIGGDVWVHTGRRDSLRVTAPRGTRTIDHLEADTAVVLSGGTIIYARSSPDTAMAVQPGSVRLQLADFQVLRPNLKPGQRVYFY